MSTAFDKFARARQVEELAAELYRILATRFSENPSARALFDRLAAEEIEHGLRIDTMKSMYSRDSKLHDEPTLDLGYMEHLLERGAVLRAKLASPTSKLTFADAKQLMARLEDSFADAHVEAMAAAGDAGLRQLFGGMAKQDRAHAELLRSA